MDVNRYRTFEGLVAFHKRVRSPIQERGDQDDWYHHRQIQNEADKAKIGGNLKESFGQIPCSRPRDRPTGPLLCLLES